MAAKTFPELIQQIETYDAYIFDLDGTLVDSSKAILEILNEWCESRELDLEIMLAASHGARITDVLPSVAPHLDVEDEVTYLLKRELEVQTGLVEIPGAGEWLQQLIEKGKPWGVATSGTKAVAKMRMNAACLPIPTVFVTAEMVYQGKPNAEQFQIAAEWLGFSTQRCLAFEDSNNGVCSALAAGCDVVVLGHECQIQHNRIIGKIENYFPLTVSEEVSAD